MTTFANSQRDANERVCHGMDDLHSKSEGLLLRLNDTTEELRALTTMTSELSQLCEVLQSENQSLKTENRDLRVRVEDLERQVRNLEREATSRELLVSGIAELPTKDLFATVTSIGATLQVEVSRADIFEAVSVGLLRVPHGRAASL